MKRNKVYSLLVCLAVCLAAAFTLGACDNDKADVHVIFKTPQEHVYILQATETKGSLGDALRALKKAKKLTYETTGSEDKEFIVSIDGFAPDAGKNEFWAIYTTLGEYNGVSYSTTEWGSFELEGKELGSASFGINGMPLIEGEVYVLAISSY